LETTYLPTYIPTYLQTYLPACLPTYLPTTYDYLPNLPTYPPTYIPIYLHAYLPTYLQMASTWVTQKNKNKQHIDRQKVQCHDQDIWSNFRFVFQKIVCC
jgi:hypothetical protein